MDEELWECYWGKREGVWVVRTESHSPPPAPPAREREEKTGGILRVIGYMGGGRARPGRSITEADWS